MKLLTQGGWTKEQKKGLKIFCKDNQRTKEFLWMGD